MKQTKKLRKKEELPSFLLNLPNKSENLSLSSKQVSDDHYLGPIFFGGCHQYHPTPHSVDLGPTYHIQYSAKSRENILEGLFLPETKCVEKHPLSKPFHPARKKHHPPFIDPYPHRCPGVRKTIVRDFVPPVINFGQTVSEIEDEVLREIPLCQYKGSTSSFLETEFKILTLSDIRERKRPFMTETERAAHAHFPKEFVPVRVVGPTIPEAVTIVKIPSKRKRISDINLDLNIEIPNAEEENLDEEEEGEYEAELEDEYEAELESDDEQLEIEEEIQETKVKVKTEKADLKLEIKADEEEETEMEEQEDTVYDLTTPKVEFLEQEEEEKEEEKKEEEKEEEEKKEEKEEEEKEEEKEEEEKEEEKEEDEEEVIEETEMELNVGDVKTDENQILEE